LSEAPPSWIATTFRSLFWGFQKPSSSWPSLLKVLTIAISLLSADLVHIIPKFLGKKELEEEPLEMIEASTECSYILGNSGRDANQL
jgi:hypothetical protein